MKPVLPLYKEVCEFIERFKCFDTGEVTQTFLNGYCYWFALILHDRFPNSEIMYYAVGKHFACKIKNRLFDITGDITHKNLFFEPWEEYKEAYPSSAKWVTEYCIDKTGI